MEALEIVTHAILSAKAAKLCCLSPYSTQHRAGPPEPRPLPTLEVSRHSRLFRENFLGPVPSLCGSALRLQKKRVVVIRFRQRGDTSGLLKQGLGFVLLIRLGVGPREQTLGAMEVIIAVKFQGSLQIWDGRGEIPQFHLG